MAIIEVTDEGNWLLGVDVKPVVFWPYTSIVQEVILKMPENKVAGLRLRLIKIFREDKINAHIDNKTVFGVEDQEGKIWYLGFKDCNFYLGTSVHSEHGVISIRPKD